MLRALDNDRLLINNVRVEARRDGRRRWWWRSRSWTWIWLVASTFANADTNYNTYDGEHGNDTTYDVPFLFAVAAALSVGLTSAEITRSELIVGTSGIILDCGLYQPTLVDTAILCLHLISPNKFFN